MMPNYHFPVDLGDLAYFFVGRMSVFCKEFPPFSELILFLLPVCLLLFQGYSQLYSSRLISESFYFKKVVKQVVWH